MIASTRVDDAPRALLVAYFDPGGLGTIVDYINALVLGSRLRIDVLNLMYCPVRDRIPTLPSDIELARYQCVIIHPTASYDPTRLMTLETRRALPLRDYAGVKVLLKQDEQVSTGRLVDYVELADFDVVATLMEADEARRVYSSQRLPHLSVIPVLPGYVSPQMLDMQYPPLDGRPIDVGYRGSLQPWNFGRLAYEKWEIGERFTAAAVRYGLRLDISSKSEDRFFGRAWFDFLGRCRATLGVESGSSIVDFTGEIEAACQEYLKAHPLASFEEVFDTILAPHENNVPNRTVSPRHFEAAACRTLQILYEGDYRGIFVPWRHYIPLRRDFSNLDDVVRALRDTALGKEITERAYEEIAANPAYGYAAFVKLLDDAIFARLEAEEPLTARAAS